MFKNKFKTLGKHEEKDNENESTSEDKKGKNSEINNNKKKIENIAFLIVILVVTLVIINSILNDNSETDEEDSTSRTLATDSETEIETTSYDELAENLEEILSTIKGVGDVNVFINYSESSQVVAMYDEQTTTSSTEETDSSGGVRSTTSTETQKEVIYSEEDGDTEPVTEKIIMPTIEGAIITAQGASNATIKTNIIDAVEAATGLSIDKIQVFEME